MAQAGVVLGLKSVPLITDNYEKVYEPLKDKTKQGVQKVKEMRRNVEGGYESEDESIDEYEGRTRGSGGRRRSPRDELRRRSGGGSVVEERYAYRGPANRARSAGRNGPRGSRRDYSDSESSLSPDPRRRRRKSLGERALVALGLGGGVAAAERERTKDQRSKSRSRRDRSRSSDYDRSSARRSRSRGVSRSQYDDDDRTPSRYKPAGYNGSGGQSEYSNKQVAKRDNRTTVSKRDKKRDSSTSSSSSSDVCSSSEDERRTRRMKGKEYLTAGLAAVATIHAAHNVYNSMEARDKRHEMVMQGEMTPEEARKLKNKARLQDAAAIGIAALGIKGAYSEWKEVQENRHELAEQQKGRQERHEKRMKKLAKARARARNQSEPDMGSRYRDDRSRDDRSRDDRY